MLEKILNSSLVVMTSIFCHTLLWKVQTIRGFEKIGGEWILLFVPVVIGFLIFKKKKG